MKTNKQEVENALLAEQLAKDILEDLDTDDFRHNPKWDIARKQIEKIINPALQRAYEAGREDDKERMLEVFLDLMSGVRYEEAKEKLKEAINNPNNTK